MEVGLWLSLLSQRSTQLYPGPKAVRLEDPGSCTQTRLVWGELRRFKKDPEIMGVGTGKDPLGLLSWPDHLYPLGNEAL